MTFVEREKRQFGYLESEYSYKAIIENNSDVRPQTDGEVEYASNSTVIVIDSETGYAAVRFYRIQDGKKNYLTPVDINEYLDTSEKEKESLLSTNPKDQSIASALFNQKFILNKPEWKSDGSILEKLELRLKNYATWLKDHAQLCLMGDFSSWPKFYEYKIKRARADYLRRGQDEMVYAQVKDTYGKYQLVKEPIFKKEFEYIEKLKKEFPD